MGTAVPALTTDAAAAGPAGVEYQSLIMQHAIAVQLKEQNDILSLAGITEVIVELTAAQVLALNATPRQLVAAPGAGYALVFEGGEVYKAAGTAYAGIAAGEDLAIKYTDASGIDVGVLEPTGFADQTTAQTRVIRPQTGALAEGTVSSFVPVENAALVAHNLVGEWITGDSPLRFRIRYRKVSMVF